MVLEKDEVVDLIYEAVENLKMELMAKISEVDDAVEELKEGLKKLEDVPTDLEDLQGCIDTIKSNCRDIADM